MHAFVLFGLVLSISSQEIGLGKVSELTFCVEWNVKAFAFQCFDAIGWAAGRASSPVKN